MQLMQCTDRIVKLAGGFFHHRQKAFWEPPAWLVVFGLYKKANFPIKEKFAAMPYVSRAYERFRDPNDT